MDLLGHYRQLASSDEWANREVLGSFRAIGNPPARALKFMAHIVAAEHVWLSRLQQRGSPLPVWPELDVQQCEEQVRWLGTAWGKYLGGPASLLDEMIAYKNSKGEAYESLARDILTHVFMHSAYHRGQIATEMRAAGYAPAYTDFIHGVRQGIVK